MPTCTPQEVPHRGQMNPKLGVGKCLASVLQNLKTTKSKRFRRVSGLCLPTGTRLGPLIHRVKDPVVPRGPLYQTRLKGASEKMGPLLFAMKPQIHPSGKIRDYSNAPHKVEETPRRRKLSRGRPKTQTVCSSASGTLRQKDLSRVFWATGCL